MRLERLALGVALLAGGLLAQDYRGSVVGRVTDRSGAVIAGVSISALNEATNVSSMTRSNAEGNFMVSQLDPGVYTVAAEAASFKKLLHSGITVRTGDKLTLDFQLEVSDVSDSVTVMGQTPLVETNSGNISAVVDQRLLSSLHTSNRNPWNWLRWYQA